jgi:lysophospholipase L1-like esterase
MAGRLLALLGLALVLAMPARAAGDAARECDGPDSAIQTNGALPFFRAALSTGSVRIAVLGTGSARNEGAGAWPDAFQEALAARLGKRKAQVEINARRGDTAEQQLAALAKLLESKPALVIWQTGTVDAVRQIDVDDFSDALTDGIEKAAAAGADVVLVGPQYAPRAGTLVNFARHIAIMAQMARAHDAPFLDRYALMQDWSDTGRVNLDGGKETWPAAAKFVQACVGLKLADLIATAAELDGSAR